MAEDEDAAATEGGDDTPKKKSKLPLILGVLLMLGGGGGAFFATFSGMLGGGEPAEEGHEEVAEAEPLEPVAFVPLDPIIIAVRSRGRAAHLRFRAELEVEPDRQEEVTLLMPRILDVLNTYLRAVEIGEIERPSALMSLRAQMLRRIQIVTGEGRVKDLLVTEFVVN
ncbi:flagellar basal body-associated protein FliL [Vannielia litorea]|uniref:flagellar basal body-associated FliL family protein n=1 Tax=Vannielia litorea TaxID=1217970 RepID=UPI001C9522A1|nr:flagellar basal body-associated FliL family protein [Vannielia litorea]MBY6048850.1 flagellar basal body-associated FliL family protein [Vannielia litorea]MBY6076264.1 flagellar basal body-associated FliL family protein [Vannielia litorea]